LARRGKRKPNRQLLPQKDYSPNPDILDLPSLEAELTAIATINAEAWQKMPEAKRIEELLQEMESLTLLQEQQVELELRSVPFLQNRLRSFAASLAAKELHIWEELNQLLGEYPPLTRRYGHLIATYKPREHMATSFSLPATSPHERETAAAPATVDEIMTNPLPLPSSEYRGAERVQRLHALYDQVYLEPDLSLRSPEKESPAAPPVEESSSWPKLVVSGERSTDWRDYHYASARASQGSGGQSHMRFRAISGGNEVGGACYLLQLLRHNIHLMIDAGIKLGQELQLPNLSQVPKPDYIVITHPGMERCGALPHMVSLWPRVKIICSITALPLIKHTLRQLCENSTLDHQPGGAEGDLYTYKEIDDMQFIGLEYGVPFPLQDTGLTLTLWQAGHTLGSASVAVRGSQDSFFYTGEYATHQEPTVAAAQWPDSGFDVVVATSSGYLAKAGERLNSSQNLLERITQVVNAGGWAILPIFEVGRAQDIYLTLKNAVEENRIPSLPLYWEGAQHQLALLYGQLMASEAFTSTTTYLETYNMEHLPEDGGVLLVNPGFSNTPQGSELLRLLLSHPASVVFLPFKADTLVDLRTFVDGFADSKQLQSYSWLTYPTEEELAAQLQKLHPLAVIFVYGTGETQRSLCAAMPQEIIRRALPSGRTLLIRQQTS